MLNKMIDDEDDFNDDDDDFFDVRTSIPGPHRMLRRDCSMELISEVIRTVCYSHHDHHDDE